MNLDDRSYRPLASRVMGLCRSLLGWPARVARARQAMNQMAGMDDRELADVGLYRQDLRDAASLALDQDPTELLARRVNERRASRGQARDTGPIAPVAARLPCGVAASETLRRILAPGARRSRDSRVRESV